MFHAVTATYIYSHHPALNLFVNGCLHQGEENDRFLVNFTVEEIRRNTLDSFNNELRLYQGAVYSWQFNARRAQKIEERLNQLYPGEYVFVTVDQLESLYRQAMNLQAANQSLAETEVPQ